MAVKTLEARLTAVEKEVQRLRDIEAIRKLENAYSFYLVMWMPDEIIDLFSKRDDVALIWPTGTFLGTKGLNTFFRNSNTDASPDFLHQQMQISGVIDIAEDGKTGRGRWWGFGGMALPTGKGDLMQSYMSGIYENEFIRENGVWKFWKVRWVPVYASRPSTGWVENEKVAEVPFLPGGQDPFEPPDWWQPDIPGEGIEYSYPSGYILPFHFKHPVTGKSTSEGKRNAKVKRNQ